MCVVCFGGCALGVGGGDNKVRRHEIQHYPMRLEKGEKERTQLDARERRWHSALWKTAHCHLQYEHYLVSTVAFVIAATDARFDRKLLRLCQHEIGHCRLDDAVRLHEQDMIV